MTIAQQLKVTEFPFTIKDNRGNVIYWEGENGFWWKKEINSNLNQTRYEDSSGYWARKEFNSKGKEIYYENSMHEIRDRRPKPVTELTMDEIALKFNVPVETLKIKK